MVEVSRRGFIGTTAGLIATKLLPAWARTETLDLTPFCDEYHYHRYDLTNPFEQLGWTYATDGRICVRTMLVPAPADAEEVKRPRASELGWDPSCMWKPWPKFPKTVKAKDWHEHPCPDCNTKGLVGPDVTMCERCDGEGYEWVGVMGEYERRCAPCQGRGFLGSALCGRCGGKGHVDYFVRLGETAIAPRYDTLIRNLDTAEYYVKDVDSPIHFRFNGGQGMLMPLAED